MSTSPDAALDEATEWPIPLPTEGAALRDRALEARNAAGTMLTRWVHTGHGWTRCAGRSVGAVGIAGFADLFPEIIAAMVENDLVLVSVPRTATDATTQGSPR